MVVVALLKSEDRPAWEELASGYKAFYRMPTTDEQYEVAWRATAGRKQQVLRPWRVPGL